MKDYYFLYLIPVVILVDIIIFNIESINSIFRFDFVFYSAIVIIALFMCWVYKD